MDIKQTLADFVGSELLDDDEPIGHDENLLADGMVDSLGMLRLVAHIEETLGLKVPPEDFTIENFRTIELLGAYLNRRSDDQAASGASH